MLIDIPTEINHIITKLEQNSFEAWLVGGCVRDYLMGITPKDYDICTSAQPEQIISLFNKTISTGIKYGTITVLIGNCSVEVTTFRADSDYTDHRRPNNVIYSRSLAEDLKRRDFTINAIAYNPVRGIKDPHNGQKDISDRIIRTVGDPTIRFYEDALRMLRAIRFKARFNYDIHIETKSAIESLAQTIKFVSYERILTELNEILSSTHPEAFIALYKLGLINFIFPLPILSMPDMKPFNQLEEKLSVRWAALLWQMGFCINGNIEKICRNFKMSNAMTKEIAVISDILNRPLPYSCYNIRLLMASTSLNSIQSGLTILRTYNFYTAEINYIEKTMKLIIENKHCISLSNLAIDGNDLIAFGFKPGKQLGEFLEILFLCVLQNPFINHKDILLTFAGYITSKVNSTAINH